MNEDPLAIFARPNDEDGRRKLHPSTLPPALTSGTGAAVYGPYRFGLPSGRSWWEIDVYTGVLELVTGPPFSPVAQERRPVTGAVPWVTALSRDVDTGAELVTLTWRAGPAVAPKAASTAAPSTWHEVTVGRATVADPRALAALADRGFPVTAGPMAKGLVDWIHDCIMDPAFTRARGDGPALASTRLGWVGPDASPDGWVTVPGWGDGPDGTLEADGMVRLRLGMVLPRGRVGAGWIDCGTGAPAVKLAPPGGLEVLARGLAPAGAPGGLAPVLAAATPPLLVALGASWASALLRPLGLAGFLLDLSGATSGGKTSALRLAAALWGDPDQLVRTWRDSDAFLYRTAAFLGSVPVFLDDTKTENDPRRVASTIYSLTSGVERGRGTADGGVQAPRSWRSVGLLTGEQRLTSFSSDAGTRARVLPVWGQVFRCAEDAEDAVEAARAHHGHLGPALIEHIFGHGNAEVMRAVFRSEAGSMAAVADGAGVNGAIAFRLRLPAAAVMTALLMAQGCGLLPRDCDLAPVAALLRRAVREGSADADQPLAALLAVESERAQHPDRWADARTASMLTPGATPTAGWAGVYDDARDIACWLPNVLDTALTRAGFRPAETRARWADRGWLALDKSGDNPRVGLTGSRPRMVAVKVAHLVK